MNLWQQHPWIRNGTTFTQQIQVIWEYKVGPQVNTSRCLPAGRLGTFLLQKLSITKCHSFQAGFQQCCLTVKSAASPQIHRVTSNTLTTISCNVGIALHQILPFSIILLLMPCLNAWFSSHDFTLCTFCKQYRVSLHFFLVGQQNVTTHILQAKPWKRTSYWPLCFA